MEELEIDPPSSEPEPEQSPNAPQTVSIEEWMASAEPGVEEAPKAESLEDTQLLAVLEACVYVAEEPLMPAQIAAALNQDPERIRTLLNQLAAEFERPEHGISIKEVAGGYKMATKAEHHDAVRSYVKSLKTPLKLSLPALETLAVIAYKQPVTTPEIMEIRGVQGGGVLKTLLDRKLIAEAGRKNVLGKPILYKTTKEFLIQFGLKDIAELPSLKEFEEIRRMAMSDTETPAAEGVDAAGSGAEDASAGPEAGAADVAELEDTGESQSPVVEASIEAEAPAEPGRPVDEAAAESRVAEDRAGSVSETAAVDVAESADTGESQSPVIEAAAIETGAPAEPERPVNEAEAGTAAEDKSRAESPGQVERQDH